MRNAVSDDDVPAGVSRFTGEHVDPATAARVRVEIDVPDALFDAQIDWQVMGARLDWVGSRASFQRPIVRAAQRAMRVCVTQIREGWAEVNPDRSDESPVSPRT